MSNGNDLDNDDDDDDNYDYDDDDEIFFFQSGHRRHERKNPSTPSRGRNYDLPISIPDDDNVMMITSSRYNIRKGYLTMNFV